MEEEKEYEEVWMKPGGKFRIEITQDMLDDSMLELEDELLKKKKVRLTGKYKEKRYIP